MNHGAISVVAIGSRTFSGSSIVSAPSRVCWFSYGGIKNERIYLFIFCLFVGWLRPFFFFFSFDVLTFIIQKWRMSPYYSIEKCSCCPLLCTLTSIFMYQHLSSSSCMFESISSGKRMKKKRRRLFLFFFFGRVRRESDASTRIAYAGETHKKK